MRSCLSGCDCDPNTINATIIVSTSLGRDIRVQNLYHSARKKDRNWSRLSEEIFVLFWHHDEVILRSMRDAPSHRTFLYPGGAMWVMTRGWQTFKIINLSDLNPDKQLSTAIILSYLGSQLLITFYTKLSGWFPGTSEGFLRQFQIIQLVTAWRAGRGHTSYRELHHPVCSTFGHLDIKTTPHLPPAMDANLKFPKRKVNAWVRKCLTEPRLWHFVIS